MESSARDSQAVQQDHAADRLPKRRSPLMAKDVGRSVRLAKLRVYDVVRIARLRVVTRAFTGTASVMREPRVGDIGTICYEHTSDSAAPVVVEMVNLEGLTVWLADFDRDELEPVDSHCASKP